MNYKKDLEIIEGSLSDLEIEELSKLFERNFSKKYSPKFIKWYYCLNPNGKAITFNVKYLNKIVGHYALVPIKILFNQKIYNSALSVFTAIDKKFRGLLLFNELAQKAYSSAKQRGINFIIGISNNNSTMLFVKYFKFKLISQLDVKLGIGKLSCENSNINFKVWYDPELIKWRMNNPNYQYKLKSHKNDLLIYNDYLKFLNIVMARFSVQEFDKLENNLYRKKKFNFFNMWIGLGVCNWEMSYYFDLPNKLKPSPLNFILKDMSDNNLFSSLRKENIKFQLFDFDIF